MSSSQPSTSLALVLLVGGRALAGSSALLSPLNMTPLFGLSITPSASFLSRLFGSRDLLLALGSWFDVQGLARGQFVRASGVAARTVITLGMLIDAVDVVSGLVDYNSGTLSQRGAVIGAGGAAALVGLAVSVLSQ
ncbi:hypothetical protein DMC30DRAFT_209162 [Rhodotorula diobovata]|uniref:Uncharacterized protein n=1 Tax=Rhodotorula diobovata TaxID=5288 RepID=A0A5C5FY62_9BASI|nr:hypothetical protein DMC30DRAFT_209162 [Rhodotorula diobovata]